VTLPIIEIILAPAGPFSLLQISFHVHNAAIWGIRLPLEPFDRAIKERHAHGALRHAVQEHDVVLFGAAEELGGEQRDTLRNVGAAFTVRIPAAVGEGCEL
jgi:hypothetical protein